MKKLLLSFVALLLAIPAMAAENITSGTVLYLKPSPEWTTDNARFAAYFFGNGDAWVSMTQVETGVYAVTSPNKSYPNVIFCRMNPSNTANNWNNKWNQTADLSYDGKNNCYSVSGWGGGSWGTYTLPAIPDGLVYYEGEFSIFVINNKNWSTVNAWVWGKDKFNYTGGSWPGKAMTKLSVKSGSYDCYQWTYTGSETAVPTGVVFNNGSNNQTADLEYVNGGVYTAGGALLGIVDATAPCLVSDVNELAFSTEVDASETQTITITPKGFSGDITYDLYSYDYLFTVTPNNDNTYDITFTAKKELTKYETTLTFKGDGVEDVVIPITAETTIPSTEGVYEEGIVSGANYYLQVNMDWTTRKSGNTSVTYYGNYYAKFVNENDDSYAWVKGGYIYTGMTNYVHFYLAESNTNTVTRSGETPAYTHVIFFRSDDDYKDLDDESIENAVDGLVMKAVTEPNVMLTLTGSVVSFPTAIEGVEVADGIRYAYGVVEAEGAIEVYSINGAVVARGNDTVDLRGLNRGIYIVRNGDQVRKVVR